MANFYVVATPIGNRQDITKRAIDILSSVDAVLCEDTRTTGKLFEFLGIKNKLISYHSKSSRSKHNFIIDLLSEGKDLALVSDAGTPTISDPGFLVIKDIYEKFNSGEVKVLAIPGPSALISALSVSGLKTSEFTFLGFMPQKKGRETLIKEILLSERTIVFYESTHRIMKTLNDLEKVLSQDRMVVVVRELTKIFEEVVRGSAFSVNNYFKENKEKIRGEFVVIVSGL